MYLKKEVLKKISLGYRWNSEMTIREFCRKNRLSIYWYESTEAFNKINDRYLEWIDKNL